jgi:CDP-6-deoxy-D-xylo-4-hexulose-3-dehydrase
MKKMNYPCTGKVSTDGFSRFFDLEMGEARRNISLFTQELGQRFAFKNACLVNSGSSANLVAALALAQTIRKEGRPLRAVTAGLTFPTTLSALLLAGFDVRVADTEKDGFNLCPDALTKLCHDFKPTLVCVTHFLGFPARMGEIKNIAQEYDALILQDACETMDLKDDTGLPMHRHGDITTWSFYHPHHLSSYGGGAVICVDDDMHRLCDSISHWGRACTCHIDPASCAAPEGFSHNFTYVNIGINVEMSELNACFGRFQLKMWDDIERKRKTNYKILFDMLSDCSNAKTYAADPAQGSPFVFPIMLDGPAASVIETLAKSGIECRSLMGGAIIAQPAYRHIQHDGCQNALDISGRSFFVGVHQTLAREDIRHVGSKIWECLVQRKHKSLAV